MSGGPLSTSSLSGLVQQETVLLVDEKELEQLDEARGVQQRQLTGGVVQTATWRVAGAVVPCGQLGGDVYDVVAGASGELTVFAIDVSGHGLAAALVAASARAAFQLLLRDRPLAEAIEGLNEHLCDLHEEHYACVAAIRIEGDDAMIVNAGLPPVCVTEGHEIVARAYGAGTPPGLFPGGTYTTTRCRITPLTRFFLMTDGLTEPFGASDDVDGALRRLGMHDSDGTSTNEDLSARIAQILDSEGAVRADDATFVAIEPRHPCRTFAGNLGAIDEAVEWALAQSPCVLDRARAEIGLTEAVANAIVHGILGVRSSLRAASLESYLDEIAFRSATTTYAARRLSMAVSAAPGSTTYWLRWDGDACEESQRTPVVVDPGATAGRGLSLIAATFDDVVWSDDGRSVALSRRDFGT